MANGTGNGNLPSNQRVITIVVVALAIDGFIGTSALAWCLVNNIKPDPTLLTAFVGLTSGLTGVLGGMLMSTRATSTNPPEQTKPAGEVEVPAQKLETKAT